MSNSRSLSLGAAAEFATGTHTLRTQDACVRMYARTRVCAFGLSRSYRVINPTGFQKCPQARASGQRVSGSANCYETETTVEILLNGGGGRGGTMTTGINAFVNFSTRERGARHRYATEPTDRPTRRRENNTALLPRRLIECEPLLAHSKAAE